MGVDITEAFPDSGGAICASFFAVTDASEKAWNSLQLLAESDDVSFWTVVAHHPRLPDAMTTLITAVDEAHSSTSITQRRRVKEDHERCLVTVLIRLTSRTDICSRRNVNCGSLANCIGRVLPVKVMPSAALVVLRRSGSAAAIILTCMVLLNPAYLCVLPRFLVSWYDNINRIATRCVVELQRGRYQRLSGDILPLFEQTYRATKHFWALLHSLPFVANYVHLSRTLRAFRIVIDVISPLLQHFLLTCGDLSTRRDILSRANSVIVNAAVNSATVLIAFRTFNTAGDNGVRAHCLSEPVRAVSDKLQDYVLQYVTGTPHVLLSNWRCGGVYTLLHQLVPPIEETEDIHLGKVLLSLVDPITDSKDFSDALRTTRQRFYELVLIEMVHQGFHIENLLESRFLSPVEARKLGASESCVAHALAEDSVEDPEGAAPPGKSPNALSPPPAPVDVQAPVSVDPSVSIVLDVFPSYSAPGVRAALNYYNNDVEQFILDASMGNLPPHLVSQLNTTPKRGDEVGPSAGSPHDTAPDDADALSPVSHSTRLNEGEVDESLLGVDLHLYLGSGLHPAAGDAGDEYSADAEIPEGVDYRTHQADYDLGNASSFDIDENIKDKIRMVMDLMYDDELDDGQADVHLQGADGHSDDDEPVQTRKELMAGGPVSRVGGDEPDAVRSGPERAPRDHYHDKRFYARMERDNAQHAKKMKALQSDEPAYARKSKTSKKNLGRSGNALIKKVRKGKGDDF